MNARAEEIGSLCRNGDVLLVPYVELEGRRTLTDSQVIAGFDGLVSDGLVETVFPSGEITEPDDFLTFARSPGVLMTFIYAREQLAGFSWLSHLQRNWALGNFALYRSVWGPKSTEIGKTMLNLWFHMEHQGRLCWQTIGGITPSENRRAIAYIRRLGFTIIGEIPVGTERLTISHLTRGAFYGRR